jgi:O-antigen/teichoic acid export membrane protein
MGTRDEVTNSRRAPLFQTIARGSVIGIVLPVVGIAKSIVLIPILLSTLGEHSYGLYVLVATGVSYALIVAGYGLDASMYRFAPAKFSVDGGRSTFSACLFIAAITGGLVCLAGIGYLILRSPIEEPHYLPVIGGAICLCQALWSVCVAYERARDRLVLLVTVTVIFSLLEFCVFVVLAYYWRDVVLIFSGVLALNVVWTVLWLVRQVRHVGLSRPTRPEISAIWQFGGHTVVNTLVLGAFLTIDKFVLGYAAGPAELAYYAPAAGLALVLGSLAALSQISIPQLLALAHDEARSDDVRLILRYGLGLYFCVAVPALLGIWVTAEPILYLLVGADLAERGSLITVVFAGALFILGIQRFAALYLRNCGLASWVNFVAAASLAGYIMGIVIAMQLGLDLAYAIPVIYLLTMIVQTGITYRRVYELIGSAFRLNDAVVPALVGMICIGPGLLLDLSNWLTLVLYILCAALCYFGLFTMWTRIEPTRFGLAR